ncbi:MAG TPA: GNAT family N-acetyltransferase [Bryobacteraceae bacterium]|jgi:glycosyltransferase involved in cell wall biosynthesis/ribosomal protein S18 acetylase RimI-like enzyme
MIRGEMEVEPIRVLHVVGDSRFGGIAGIILGLGRVARAEGWQVDVLTTDPAVQNAVRQAGLGVVALDVIRREIRPVWDLWGMLRLRRFLRRQPYRIVHTHTSKGGFVGRLAARLARVPVIVHTAHGFAFHERSSPSVRLFYSALERIASSWCDRIVSVSEFHQTWALDLGICDSSKILAIPNGICARPLRHDFDAAALRRELDLRSDEILILSVARLAVDKGVDDLIAAAALLPCRGFRYRVLIAGDGPQRSRFERMVREKGLADRVTLLGFRSDIGELLAASDLVVLPSLREGLSITLLEAMAAGKPIIASNIGSNREVAAQAEMARLVPAGNPEAIAEAIEHCTRNTPLRARLAASARTLFEHRYTENRMLDEYRKLYLDLLESKSPVPKQAVNGSDGNAMIPSRFPVRPATTDDLPGIVAAHRRAFAGFFLTRLGPEFLRVYYDLVLAYGSGIVLVSEHRGLIDGFACGFLNPGGFYRLMWEHRSAFLWPALCALVRQPTLAAKVLDGVKRVRTTASEEQARSCELSSIAVLPEASAQGLGRTLMRAFIAQSWSMNADSIYLTTDAENNGRANILYREAGFQLVKSFLQAKGRWMNEYVIRRSAGEWGVVL